jgi:hypothetical protein
MSEQTEAQERDRYDSLVKQAVSKALKYVKDEWGDMLFTKRYVISNVGFLFIWGIAALIDSLFKGDQIAMTIIGLAFAVFFFASFVYLALSLGLIFAAFLLFAAIVLFIAPADLILFLSHKLALRLTDRIYLREVRAIRSASDASGASGGLEMMDGAIGSDLQGALSMSGDSSGRARRTPSASAKVEAQLEREAKRIAQLNLFARSLVGATASLLLTPLALLVLALMSEGKSFPSTLIPAPIWAQTWPIWQDSGSLLRIGLFWFVIMWILATGFAFISAANLQLYHGGYWGVWRRDKLEEH